MEKELKTITKDLPISPGVYLFKDKAEAILYIGKAKNIKKRVQTHFIKTSVFFSDFIKKIASLDFIKVDTEEDALILEAELIKKYQPRYNIDWKDDKNYTHVAFVKKDWLRVLTTYRPAKEKYEEVFGPFVHGFELKKLLNNLRKIFPYCGCQNKKRISCLYSDLELCPAPFEKTSQTKQQQNKYNNSLKALSVFLKLYEVGTKRKIRIEGYDISNTSGSLAVGSMVVWQNSQMTKSAYRKFKIKTVAGQNDVESLKEILNRRLKHQEWPLPDLIMLDGGRGQLKSAADLNLPVIALSKIGRLSGRLHSPYSHYFVSLDTLPDYLKNVFLQIRDEAHRFAISYHKKRRLKKFES